MGHFSGSNFQLFARKIIRLFGHVTAEDIDNEARAVSALCCGGQCKYLVDVFEHGWLTGAKTDYFIDMEYCPETLEDMMTVYTSLPDHKRPKPIASADKDTGRNGDLRVSARSAPIWSEEFESTSDDIEWDPILRIFEDISSGLAFIHSKRFVHRDLKPTNGIAGVRHTLLTSSSVF